jgi:phage shock protein PspC (stress-responsive transcriptional regulator)/predicted membrane protein
MDTGDEPTREQEQAPEPQPRRLTRSREDRVLGGVCGGLGRYFDVDPVLFRIGAVALVLFGGAGLLLYLAAIFLIPDERSGSPDGRGLAQRGLAIVGVVLLVVAAGSILSHGPFHLWFAWPLGLLLVLGLGVWFLIAADRESDGSVRNAGQRLLLVVLVLVGSAFIAAGGAWLAGTGNGTIAGIAVVAAGGALAVAAFTTRSGRWLIVPALALALPVGVVEAAGIDLHGGAGDRDYRPVAPDQVRASYRVGAGRLTVDLRDAHLTAGDHPLRLRVGMGQAVLVVPSNVCVASHAKVGIGQVQSFDRSNGGVDVDWNDQPTTAGANPRVVLDARVGMGQVLISHTREDRGFGARHRFFTDLADQTNSGCEVANATR